MGNKNLSPQRVNAPDASRVSGMSQPLPKPVRVPEDEVGEVVQDFIDFGGVTAIEVFQEKPGIWVVRAKV